MNGPGGGVVVPSRRSTSRIARPGSEALNTVAALYLQPTSVYYELATVEAWGPREDATEYPGELPVVAHPTCGPWSHFYRRLASTKWKHHGPIAVEQVRRWGGVLEHPALSHLWGDQGLSVPNGLTLPLVLDPWGGYSIEVEQCWWGHPQRKRTWLYIVGVPPADVQVPSERSGPDYDGPSASMRFDKRRGTMSRRSAGDMLPPGSRSRTRAAFARWLVELARKAAAPPTPASHLLERAPRTARA